MAKPVAVGPRQYPTKKAALDEIKAMLAKYPDNDPDATPKGSRIVDDPDDEAFLRDLAPMHPDAEEKIGDGIDHFEVRVYDYGTRGFCIVRTDGTDTDFSAQWAINSQK